MIKVCEPWQAVVDLHEAVLANEVKGFLHPKLNDWRLARIRRTLVQGHVLRVDDPQALLRRTRRRLGIRTSPLGLVHTERVAAEVAIPLEGDQLPRRAVVVAVAAVLRVAVEAFGALLTIFTFGVVQAEASPGDLVTDPGREILVAVAEARLAAYGHVAGVSESPDDADVALFAGGVVLTLVARVDAVAARGVAVAAAVNAAVWP